MYNRVYTKGLHRYEHLYSFQQLSSQAANKALDSFYIKSKLVWDCHQFLVKVE